MTFILFFLGTVGASAQSNDAANPTTGRIVFIEPKGALKVRQAKRLRLCKVTAGTLVRRGYVLILDAAGRATVICGDGKKRELAPATSRAHP